MPKLSPLPYSDFSGEEVDVKYTKKGYNGYYETGYRILNRETGEEIGIVYKVVSHSVGSRGKEVWRAEATNGNSANNRVESHTRDGATVYALTDFFRNKVDQ